MSKIKNDELDQYGAEPLEQQQFGTAGVEGVKMTHYVSSGTLNSAHSLAFKRIIFLQLL